MSSKLVFCKVDSEKDIDTSLLAGFFGKDETVVFTAKTAEGLVIGIAAETPNLSGGAEIFFAVLPAHRFQGHGKQMVSEFIEVRGINKMKMSFRIQQGNLPAESIAENLGLYRILGSEQYLEPGQPPIIEWQMPTTGQA